LQFKNCIYIPLTGRGLWLSAAIFGSKSSLGGRLTQLFLWI